MLQQLILREFFRLLADGGWSFIEDLCSDCGRPGFFAKIMMARAAGPHSRFLFGLWHDKR